MGWNMIFRLFITLALLSPSYAFAATITSKAVTGNLSTPTNWVGDVAPVDGDTITVVSGANITIDRNVIVGDSPAAGNAVLTVASGGAVAFADNISVIIRGDFYLSGPFVMGQGAILEFDSSLSASPSTTSYEWRYAIDGSTTTITINGATNNRCTIRSNPGGKNAFLNCPALNFQKWTETNCDWYRFGGSGTYSIYIRIYEYAVGKGISVVGSTYDSLDKAVYISANGVTDGQTDISLDKLWIRNSAVYPVITMDITEATTGKRELTNSYVDRQVLFPNVSGLAGWNLSGSVFTRINTGSVFALKSALAANECILMDMEGTTGQINLGTLHKIDFTELLAISHVAATSHQEGIINGANFSIDGAVWEGSGQVSEAPILVSPTTLTTSAAYDVSVKNTLAIPNPAGSGLGMIVEMKGSKYTRVTMENVTAAVGASAEDWGLIKSSWGSNSRGFVGHIESVKNNLLWNPVGNDSDRAFIINNVRSEAVRTGTAGASSTATVLYSNQLLTGVSSGEGSYYVKITSGADAGLIRAVTANDATTITVGAAFPNSTANQTYELFPLDQVTAADYNATFGVEADGGLYDSSNIEARTSVVGYTGMAQTTPADIGAHDIVLSSLSFVDSSRNIYRWATATSGLNRPIAEAWADTTPYSIGDSVSRGVAGFYGGDPLNYRCIKAHTASSSDAPGGWTSANWRTNWVPEGLYLIIQAKLQRSGYVESATQAAYMAWVRRGWAPTTAALATAGEDGTYIGAMDVVSLGNPAALMMVQ